MERHKRHHRLLRSLRSNRLDRRLCRRRLRRRRGLCCRLLLLPALRQGHGLFCRRRVLQERSSVPACVAEWVGGASKTRFRGERQRSDWVSARFRAFVRVSRADSCTALLRGLLQGVGCSCAARRGGEVVSAEGALTLGRRRPQCSARCMRCALAHGSPKGIKLPVPRADREAYTLAPIPYKHQQ